MKRLFILIMLVLVVAASGCTNQQSTSSNKTYSANGVSFAYPGNWTEQNLTSLQSQAGSSSDVLGVVGDGAVDRFGVFKLNPGSNQRVVSLSEWASNYNSTMKKQGSTYVSERSLTVDGVKAYQVTMLKSGTYGTDVFFIKNGTGYIATYTSKNNDNETIDLLINNLKIS
jgi:hypothetical protein